VRTRLRSVRYMQCHNAMFWLENLEGRDNSENLGVNGKIILEWILEKQDEKVWI